jgi:hypothetical protein
MNKNDSLKDYPAFHPADRASKKAFVPSGGEDEDFGGGRYQ